mmetsp:Transcript_29246/g.66262  ORF Transcript_29246/g.66262 Transcript_29246/m.66262 type:complete len:206 (+) Transcript_29246:217-834(+)
MLHPLHYPARVREPSEQLHILLLAFAQELNLHRCSLVALEGCEDLLQVHLFHLLLVDRQQDVVDFHLHTLSCGASRHEIRDVYVSVAVALAVSSPDEDPASCHDTHGGLALLGRRYLHADVSQRKDLLLSARLDGPELLELRLQTRSSVVLLVVRLLQRHVLHLELLVLMLEVNLMCRALQRLHSVLGTLKTQALFLILELRNPR